MQPMMPMTNVFMQVPVPQLHFDRYREPYPVAGDVSDFARKWGLEEACESSKRWVLIVLGGSGVLGDAPGAGLARPGTEVLGFHGLQEFGTDIGMGCWI